MTTEQNRYACAAEKRFLMMISQKFTEVGTWGEVVDLLFENRWSDAANLCYRSGLEDDAEKISELYLTSN